MLLAGCESPSPMNVSPQFAAERSNRNVTPLKDACRVRIAAVNDARTATDSMGQLAGRPIRAQDSLQWVGSAFDWLSRDRRLKLVSEGDPADLVLTVDLLKAYVRSGAGMGKAANVVVRVRYTPRNGAEDVQLYRGIDTGVNWATAEDETKGVLNRALNQVLNQVNDDTAERCAKVLAVATETRT